MAHTVVLSGNALTWVELGRGLKIFFSSAGSFSGGCRIAKCRVHPVRIIDVMKWPEEYLKLCEWESTLRVHVGKLVLIVGDFSVKRNEMIWS